MIQNDIITDNQLTSFLLELKKFREERDLTVYYQKEGLLANLLKKLAQYSESNSNEEKVNIICDMVIFILNASGLTSGENIFKDVSCAEASSDVKNIIEKILVIDYNKVDFNNFEVQQKMFDLLTVIWVLGYNPYCSLVETLKEASSKKGKWNDDEKKFIKLPGFFSAQEIEERYPNDSLIVTELENSFRVFNTNDGYTVMLPKWYKANYNLCLIK